MNMRAPPKLHLLEINLSENGLWLSWITCSVVLEYYSIAIPEHDDQGNF